ncbi:carboxypeptidase regulatory-like domain-containing protein [Candidatus Woesearchaeota archaeon]|nr:carboxypeptidase regulatory-like domain-containing protein [Candidatus Woesearchaeota archaeon]
MNKKRLASKFKALRKVLQSIQGENRIIGQSSSKTDRLGQVLTIILTVIVISVALFSVVKIAQFIGYAIFTGRAGYVYELNLVHKLPATYWSAIYGVAVRVPGYTNLQYYDFCSGTMQEANLLFDCMQPKKQHEVYASLVPPDQIDWDSVQAVNPSVVDEFMNIQSSSRQSATNTYTETVSLELGSRQINAYGTHSYDTNGTRFFATGALVDGNGNLLFFALTTNFTRGFNNRIYNYQMLLPIPNGTNGSCLTYYFSTDPYDVCPQGEGELPNFGNVTGNVTNTEGVPLPNVIVHVGGYSAVSDENGHYSLSAPEGDYYIFAIKTGYKVYYNNVTIHAFNTTVHNIVMEMAQPPTTQPGTGVGPGVDEPGVGSGTGTGTGTGPGQIPPIPIIEQPKVIEGEDFFITVAKIDRKLRENSFLQEEISVVSYKKTSLNLKLKVEGNVTDMITLDKDVMIVPPKDKDSVVLTIFGNKPVGKYNGSLMIQGSGINISIPIKLEVLPESMLPVEALVMNLELLDKKANPGQEVRLKTDLHNMLVDLDYPVKLYYTLQDLQGNTLWSTTKNVHIKTSVSLITRLKLPKDIKTGEYVLRVTASYLGLTSAKTALLKVTIPLYMETLFWKFKVWHLAAFLGFITSAVLGFLYYKKYQESKKKYHLKVELSELPKPGPKSIFVGKIAETAHKAYFNLEQLKIHTIVAGTTGGGKTVAAQVIVEEALMKNVAVIVFDPTAQWSGFLRKQEDKGMLRLYPYFGMKPEQARAFPGNVRMVTDAYELIDIKKYMKPGEIHVFTLNKLDPKDIDIFVANTIRQVFKANFEESKELKLLLVYDEVHRLLPKFGGSGEGFVQIERGCREFRKWGVGILLVSQVLADFVGQIKANINTEIQMRTRDEGDLNRIATKYGEEVLRSLVKASVGTGMVQNASYNRGRPFFVTFRPLLHNVTRLTDEELEKYNKYNNIIDELEWQLQQLEELNVDVFDLKLELKLATEKLKTGNFNMVEVYLEGLKPRIAKHWEKLGKKPKPFVKKRVSVEELKKAVEEAKKEREKIALQEKQAAEQAKAAEEASKTAFDHSVNYNQALNFENGVSVISLQELLDVLPTLPMNIFSKHVNDEKNDIADWVANYFNTDLGEELRVSDKQEMISKLEKAAKDKAKYKIKPRQGKSSQEQEKAQEQGGQEKQQQGGESKEEEQANKQEQEKVQKEQEQEVKQVSKQEQREKQEAQKVEVAVKTSTGQVLLQKPSEGNDEGSSGEENSESNEHNKLGSQEAETSNTAGKSSLEVEASPEKWFHLQDGSVLKSVSDLKQALLSKPDDVINFHTKTHGNDFANWVRAVFGLNELAEKLEQARDKKEMVKAIEEFKG